LDGFLANDRENGAKHGDTWRLVEGRGGTEVKSEYEGKEGVDEKVPILWRLARGGDS
jgi:hypothetical protein